jgi:hypothetical protein
LSNSLFDPDHRPSGPTSGLGRPLPLGVRLAILLGGRSIQPAWLLLVLGAIFFHVMVLDSELVTRFELRGDLATTTGKVTAVESTGVRRGGAVLGVSYIYEVTGRSHTGKSFGTQEPSVGAEAMVEYVVARPERSRIVGMRARTFGDDAAWVGLIIAAGAALALVNVRRNARVLSAIRLDSIRIEDVAPGLQGTEDGGVAVSTRALLRAVVPAVAPVVVFLILFIVE